MLCVQVTEGCVLAKVLRASLGRRATSETLRRLCPGREPWQLQPELLDPHTKQHEAAPDEGEAVALGKHLPLLLCSIGTAAAWTPKSLPSVSSRAAAGLTQHVLSPSQRAQQHQGLGLVEEAI